MPRAKTWRQLKAEGMFAPKPEDPDEERRPPVHFEGPKTAKHLSDDEKDKIECAIYNRTNSPQECAMAYGVSVATVHKIWKKACRTGWVTNPDVWDRHKSFRDRPQRLTYDQIQWIKRLARRKYTMVQNREKFFQKFETHICDTTWKEVVSGKYKNKKPRYVNKNAQMRRFVDWCRAKFPDLDLDHISRAISLWVKEDWCPISRRLNPPPAPPCPQGKNIRLPDMRYDWTDEGSVRAHPDWPMEKFNEDIERFERKPLTPDVFAAMREGRWYRENKAAYDKRLRYAGWHACRKLWELRLNRFQVDHFITHGTLQGLRREFMRG